MTPRRADAAAPDASWTTRRLLNWTADHLERKGADSPRLAAEMLLAHVLNVPRIQLYMDLDRPATPLERAAYRDLIEKAARHHPVQYLVGRAHFFSLTIEVNEHVLIPRPSTESLVEHLIQHARRTPGFAAPRIADLGTGSGCIAIALAKNLPDARIVATDISEPALDLARRNAERHRVADRIELRRGSLYEPLAAQPFDILVSNPPYIPDDEWQQVEPNVRDYEPAPALRGGPEGLDFLRPLIAHAHDHLAPGGHLAFELAASRADAARQLAAQNPRLTNPRILADHEALPRILLAERK